MALKITGTTASTTGFSANTDVSAGALVSLGTIDAPSGTVTLNWTIAGGVAGAGDVVYKFALYDGAQYSDVHTFVLTLTDSTA